jgi:hypothetical protein
MLLYIPLFYNAWVGDFLFDHVRWLLLRSQDRYFVNNRMGTISSVSTPIETILFFKTILQNILYLRNERIGRNDFNIEPKI